MTESSKPSLRIDWFDGTVIEDSRQSVPSTSQFADEEESELQPTEKLQSLEKKPIGFKRLLDLSLLQPPILTLEIANRPGFWHLLDAELKGDFIVLIVRILKNIYKSLEPEETSKISTLLKTRLVKSPFLFKLREYLERLPSVKIVDKRLNMQLWDDVEGFLFLVFELYEGIARFHRSNNAVLNEVLTSLETLEISGLGVREEHSETISNHLFAEINKLKLDILSTKDQERKGSIETKPEQHVLDPNNFRSFNIFPTKNDLLEDNKIDIKPNIVNGAYVSVEQYLDLQFKLLREDCYAPLREGISKYMENPSRRRHENIRVYPKVRIIKTYVSNNKVGHLVDIAWQDRLTSGDIDKKKYASVKRLMFGSLLLFTNNQFETILCAFVLDSNLHLLGDGYVVVSFQNPVSNKIFSESYLMVESEVFFEPYHRVLKVLQTIKCDDLPMKKYIVDVQNETQPPVYLTQDTIYSVHRSGNQEELYFPVLDSDQWPSTDTFGLDESQMSAYKFALTKEFAVIQGPPGTGKTFIGVKIASTLLKNLSLEGTPMLVICYTNHALDQFLEGILEITNNVIRLGSQSRSNILQNYTLNNRRGSIKSKYSYLYATKRLELQRIYREMTEIQSDIEKCERELISYKSLKPYLKVHHKLYKLDISKEDSILRWLFEHLDDIPYKTQGDELQDWEKHYEDLTVSDKIETCFSEQCAQKEIDSMTNSIKYIKDITDDEKESQKMIENFQNEILKVQKRLNCFKKNMATLENKELNASVPEIATLYDLTAEQRWRVYFDAVGVLKAELTSKMNDLMEQHNTCSDELSEVSTLTDVEVMKTARVVGVTTSTAARRHDLLRKLYSPIVIVEEAAEVLEAHIVASLTNHCQHLILIGDHKQLRPSAAHYKLAKDYNLEVSLFERMIRNGVHARTLITQRRMRPQFAQLLVPDIYQRLDSHPTVLSYPDVRGMMSNLYFYDHDVLEDSDGLDDSWSHKNTWEAKWCIALANYLRQMKYGPEEITILATYTGQATLMKELSKQYDLLNNVKITVVDNYQGEENRIVILSLVRSNKERKIGFLAAGNRICVALSRAKEGFYIFGNMTVLRSASAIWRSIHEKLVAQSAIGNKIVLRCDVNPQNTFDIKEIADFDRCSKQSF